MFLFSPPPSLFPFPLFLVLFSVLLILLAVAVPSVYPRNVTLRLNDTMLVVRWRPPPPDKINGILRGYDIIVRHGTQMSKVRRSMILDKYCIICIRLSMTCVLFGLSAYPWLSRGYEICCLSPYAV